MSGYFPDHEEDPPRWFAWVVGIIKIGMCAGLLYLFFSWLFPVFR